MTGWAWLVLGGVLLVLEAFTPGFAFLWLALSAGLTGLIAWLYPSLAWQVQVLLFAAVSVTSVLAWFRWRPQRAATGDDATLNRRAASCVGREAVLVEATGQGRHGRVRIGDTTWLAEGPPLAAEARVRVVAARGTVLLVEPLGVAAAGAEGSPPADSSAI